MQLLASDITEDSAHAISFSGFSIQESGGAAAVLVEFFETNASGQLLHSVKLAADQPAAHIFGYDLVGPNDSGIVYVLTTGTGTVSGVFWSQISS